MNKYLEKVAANWGKIADRLSSGKIPKTSKVFKQPTLGDKLTKSKDQQFRERGSALHDAIWKKSDKQMSKYRADRETSYVASKAGKSEEASKSLKSSAEAFGKGSKLRGNATRATLLPTNKGHTSTGETVARQTEREQGEPVNKFLDRMKSKHG